MEVVISEHLLNEAAKEFLLLKHLYSFKNDSKYIFTFNEDNIIKLKYKSQIFEFHKNSEYDEDNDEDFNEMSIQTYDSGSSGRSLYNGYCGDNEFRFVYENFVITIKYQTDIYNNKIYTYNFNEHNKLLEESITFTKEGGIFSIIGVNFKYYSSVGLVIFKMNGEEIIRNVRTFIKQDAKNFYYNIDLKNGKIGNLHLNFHPDGSLERYGMVIDSERQGFYYSSDTKGNFRISSYRNDKLHGYYFDSRSEQQGFYENGVIVGFWRIKDQNNNIRIINSRSDRIFFPFPIFLF